MSAPFRESTAYDETILTTQRLPFARVLLPFAVSYFFSYLFRTVNGPIADELVREFHLNAGGLGLLTAVYFLAFTVAQLPFGLLVDRFGPRRVQSVVFAIGALGAFLFAIADSIFVLMLARVLIGVGTSGALMAGLKALAIWIPEHRRVLANGGFIMFGGLGAMASTIPIDMLMPALGRSGVFLLLSVATLITALAILFLVPESHRNSPPEDWRSHLRSLWDIYLNPAFWRLAPLSACVIGTAFAVHGLWAARWLADVDRLAPDQVAVDLLVMGAGLTLGAGFIGLITNRLRRFGVPPTFTFALGGSLFIALQVALLDRLSLPAWSLWGAFASFGSMTVLSYSIMGELFPPGKIGRANAALNVLHLAMAFILQYGMGAVASHWYSDVRGHLPVVAYRAAFALPLALELLALAWFAGSSWASRQKNVSVRAEEVL